MRPSAVRLAGVEVVENGSISTTQPKVLATFWKSDVAAAPEALVMFQRER